MDPKTALPRLVGMLPPIKNLLLVLPFDRAMPNLLPEAPATGAISLAAQESLSGGLLGTRPELQAGIWLYVDHLSRSHEVSQGIQGSTGAAWHAIMHRREGDFANSKHWWRQAAAHPAFAQLPQFDSFRFVDEVAARHGENPEHLVDRQRMEWLALMLWCAENAVGDK